MPLRLWPGGALAAGDPRDAVLRALRRDLAVSGRSRHAAWAVLAGGTWRVDLDALPADVSVGAALAALAAVPGARGVVAWLDVEAELDGVSRRWGLGAVLAPGQPAWLTCARVARDGDGVRLTAGPTDGVPGSEPALDGLRGVVMTTPGEAVPEVWTARASAAPVRALVEEVTAPAHAGALADLVGAAVADLYVLDGFRGLVVGCVAGAALTLWRFEVPAPAGREALARHLAHRDGPADGVAVASWESFDDSSPAWPGLMVVAEQGPPGQRARAVSRALVRFEDGPWSRGPGDVAVVQREQLGTVPATRSWLARPLDAAELGFALDVLGGTALA